MERELRPSQKVRIYHNLFSQELMREVILPLMDENRSYIPFLERMREPAYLIIDNVGGLSLNGIILENEAQREYYSELRKFQRNLGSFKEIEQDHLSRVKEIVTGLDNITLEEVYQRLNMSQKDINKKAQNDIAVKKIFSKLANMSLQDHTLSPKVTASPFKVSEELFQSFADKVLSKEIMVCHNL